MGGTPFTVECDASEHTVAAILHQGGQPVAFHSLTLFPVEKRHPIVEKEAAAIIDEVKNGITICMAKSFCLLPTNQPLRTCLTHDD